MVTEPNSFEKRKFPRDFASVNAQLPETGVGQPRTESPATGKVSELTGALSAHSVAKEILFDVELEEVCLATGATGAAIALVRGQELVCHAAAGHHAPGVGASLDPRTGLSGFCIQTRQLQQCVDTQTDPRVNADACRRLAVRSIVAMPLLDGSELFGIVEILSWRPNAFSARDLDTLKALRDRIVQTIVRGGRTTATVLREAPAPLQPKVAEIVPQNIPHSPEPKAESPRPQRVPRRKDIWTPVLGLTVIGVAILLGALVGWRERAMVGVRDSSPRYRAEARATKPRADQAVSSGQQTLANTAGTQDCGQAAAAGSTTGSLAGGLTICQEGQVIFHSAPSAPLPPRNAQTPHRSTAVGGDTATR